MFNRLTPREPTNKEIIDVLQRPSHFAYYGGNKEMFVTWSLGPIIRHRDSDILQQSNADALERMLRDDRSLDDDWSVERLSHFAVGWIERLSFRAIDEHGQPTRIFKLLLGWHDMLEEHPVADEDDYSMRSDD